MFLLPIKNERQRTHCPFRREAPKQDMWDILQPLAMMSSLLESPEYYKDVKNYNTILQQSESEVTVDKDKFQANFDVQHFRPEEITVKVTGDNIITIEAKHEEKQDEHGQIYRHFIRKYLLPKNCDINRVESKLSSDGVLCITAPISDKTEPKSIPISQTGQPARSLQEKAVENPSSRS
ncbi:unnamed protein product [Psylliodes chrysocephalus]|uniref:SHSP domain-containing protein n=1 Tax=Psylliodes chrysocephalus TaxID=3402493 RepID=A0A9P0GAS1_9CUCU|nr:unnamed protein product [Psylliodes chrysocephala]